MRVGSAQVRLPAPTIRLRLTLLYGLVFLVTGAVLLTIGYELVRHNLNGDLGLPQRATQARTRAAVPSARVRSRPPDASILNAVRAQLRADALHRLLIEYVVALGAMTTRLGGGGLAASRAGAAAAARHHRHRASGVGREPGRADQPERTGRRTQAAGRHVRRDARPARRGVWQPAALRRQRLP